MIRDHRPYPVKRAYLRFQKWYGNHFLRPQLAHLGTGTVFMKPWYVELFGAPISIGRYATLIASADARIRLSIWPTTDAGGQIRIGDYSLICPGVKIGAAERIVIGDNCMMASHVYITDSDWHDIYNRTLTGPTAPVTVGDNVWLGHGAIVCKGVTIGENSIVGAGAVVVRDIPANVIAAGNPAVVVKPLAADRTITPRARWYADPAKLARELDALDRHMLRHNTWRNWIRALLFPARGD